MWTRAEFLLKSAEFEVWCFNELGVRLVCFYFHRSDEEQAKEVAAGRSKVQRSKHQDWLAKDYALFDDEDGDWICDRDEIRWNDDPHYYQMGEEWERRGGIWGGRWTDPHDIYHFEAGP